MAKEQLGTRIIGIDLGTSNSVAATAAGAQPKVLDSREGRPQIPSVVGLKKRKGKGGDSDTELLVGDVAEDNWESAAKDTIVSVKRLMGRGVADPEVQKVRRAVEYEIVEPSDGTRDSVRVTMGKKEYSPVDISAMILEKVKADAEFRLGASVTHAVITVPAYFSQIQRRATRQAGLKAGLQVIKILDEPTAAAVAFGIEQNESTDPKYILVFDLGGGTFDISVLMWAGKVFAPLSLQGDMWLGGNNFDQMIVERVVAHVKREYGVDPTKNTRFMTAARRKARTVKERLTSARSADLIVPGLLTDADGDLVDVEMEISREEFEGWIQPLVDRAVRLTETALQDAGLTVDQINHVLMAGNASAVPMVQQAMEKMFGKAKIVRSVHPKYAVAMGAAVVGTRIGPQIVCQQPDLADPTRECGHVNEPGATTCARCGRPLGLEANDASAAEDFLVVGGIAPFHYGLQTAGDKFNLFVRKNDPYPTENPEPMTFFTGLPNQRILSIPVYGGDHLDRASANEKQGEAFAVLPPGLPQDTVIRIKLWLNSDCIFELDARLENGTDLRPRVLQGEADQKAVEALQQFDREVHEDALRLSPQRKRELDDVRDSALELFQRGDFQGTIRRLDAARPIVPAGGGNGQPDLWTQAENLIGFARMVTTKYGWALGAERTYRLNQLMGKLQQALDQRDRGAVAELVPVLDKATDELGDLVWFLLNIRRAINEPIAAMDPGLAISLDTELDEVEALMKAMDPRAKARLESLAQRAAKALEKTRAKEACRHCGADLEGNRYCPKCSTDSWGLKDKKHSGSLQSISG